MSSVASLRANHPHANEVERRATTAIRNGLVEWIEASGCRWCLTLNPNRDHLLGTEIKVIRMAFADADRQLLGERFNRVDARKRILAFVMPEHLTSNLHFHLAVRPGLSSSDEIERERVTTLAERWRARVPSGTFMIEPVKNAHGWARYMTKEVWRAEAEFVSSSMWWPERQRRHVLERSWSDPMLTAADVK